MDLETAKDILFDTDIVLVGSSSNSRSTYWQITRDSDQPRLRLSDHAVAYSSSDCAVCLGNAPDDDVQLIDAASVRTAVKRLIDKQISYDLESEVDSFEREHDRLPSEEERDGLRKEIIDGWIKHATRFERRYLPLFQELSQ